MQDQNSPKNRIKINLSTIIIVTVLLYLAGMMAFLSLYCNRLAKSTSDQIAFIIELSDSTEETEIFKLEQQISKSNYSLPGSVKFIHKDEAAKIIENETLSKEEIMVFEENLLPNIIEFQIKPSFSAKENEIVAELRKNPIIAEIFDAKQNNQLTYRNLQRISLIASFLLIFLIFVAFILLRKSIDLREIIQSVEENENQVFTNSTRDLILSKYLRAGIISGGITMLLLVTTVSVFAERSKELNFFGNYFVIISISLALAAIGILIFWSSAKLSIKKLSNFNPA
jgi:cell division transport system permease protein